MTSAPDNERSLRSDALCNRLRILVAAESVFAAKGIESPTGEIARLAGVSLGTLYRHFGTKDVLVDAVFAGRAQRLAERADELARKFDPGNALFGFCAGLVGENPRDRIISYVLARAVLDAEAGATGPEPLVRRVLDDLLDRAQRCHQVRSDVGVRELLAVMAGAAVALRLAGDDSRARSRVLEVILDGLRRPGQGDQQFLSTSNGWSGS
jgi:AcrR family transcriptional regulator